MVRASPLPVDKMWGGYQKTKEKQASRCSGTNITMIPYDWCRALCFWFLRVGDDKPPISHHDVNNSVCKCSGAIFPLKIRFPLPMPARFGGSEELDQAQSLASLANGDYGNPPFVFPPRQKFSCYKELGTREEVYQYSTSTSAGQFST